MTTFPDGFLWGVATAAYQVEGAVRESGRGVSIWDTFSHTPGKVRHGDTGDIAVDQYHRYEQDIDLMAELGIQAYRFSIAWPRIQPEGRGSPNQDGLDHYRRLVDGLRARNIEPTVTLYHWDLPQALEDQGGWTNRDTSARFAEYASIIFEALKADVPLWITLNEPWVSAWLGYGSGLHAPGIRERSRALAASHHLLLGHGLGLQAMHHAGTRDARLGITLNLTPVRPASDDPADVEAARLVDGNQNRLFLDPVLKGRYPEDMMKHYGSREDLSFIRDGDLDIISGDIDFLGVNYYTRHVVTARPDPRDRPTSRAFEDLGATPIQSPGMETTAMGWTVDAEGLTDLLVRIRQEYPAIPLYITENGAAFYDYVDPEGDVDDEDRVGYLEAHFLAALTAIERGVDLRGYFVWSLIDNFEWAEGYSKRFGIVFVDYGTQRRTPKQSALWYRDVIKRNGF
jgi:beta-glucosidase